MSNDVGDRFQRRWGLVAVAALAAWAAAGCERAAVPETVGDLPGDAVARVENGLLPPIPVAGDPGWTLAGRMEHHEVPGVLIAVFYDFELSWTNAYGVTDRETGRPVTTDTLFQAGSISKPVAATGALALVDAGRLSLDAPINDVLRSWKLPDNELTRDNPVTLRHLLSHTGGTTVHGFPGYAAGQQVPTLVQVLDGEPPANTAPIRVDIPPGSRYRYSGGGTTIVQQSVIDVENRPFPEAMRELVLEPLRLGQSTYEQPLPPERLTQAAAGHRRDGSVVAGKRHVYPEMAAAGLWTTAADLARFAIGIQKAVRGDRDTLLTRPMARQMLTPVLENAGLGFFLDGKETGDTYFLHGGADEGFQALLVAHRDDGYGAAVMTNSDNGMQLAGEIVRGVARVYGWSGYVPDPVEPPKLTADELGQFLGRFRVDDDRVLRIAPRDGGLIAELTFQDDPIRLVPLEDDLLLVPEQGNRGSVRRDAEGRVVALIPDESGEREWERLPEGVVLPGELLEAGRVDEAVAAYRREQPDEGRINRLGYRLLSEGRAEVAVALFRLNTELYPDSANTYDSLADGYLAQGDSQRAAESFRQVLEAIPRDPRPDRDALLPLRSRAENFLKTM